jgi:hypothetical protein
VAGVRIGPGELGAGAGEVTDGESFGLGPAGGLASTTGAGGAGSAGVSTIVAGVSSAGGLASTTVAGSGVVCASEDAGEELSAMSSSEGEALPF